MGIEIQCSNAGEYVVVTVNGEWTEPNARRAIDAARAHAEELGLYRILLDIRELSQPHSEITRYSSGKYVAEALPIPFRTAALVAKQEFITHLAENAASNRGGALKGFTDERDAIDWLLSGRPAPKDFGAE